MHKNAATGVPQASCLRNEPQRASPCPPAAGTCLENRAVNGLPTSETGAGASTSECHAWGLMGIGPPVIGLIPLFQRRSRAGAGGDPARGVAENVQAHLRVGACRHGGRHRASRNWTYPHYHCPYDTRPSTHVVPRAGPIRETRTPPHAGNWARAGCVFREARAKMGLVRYTRHT
jgi:hypothetical protein